MRKFSNILSPLACPHKCTPTNISITMFSRWSKFAKIPNLDGSCRKVSIYHRSVYFLFKKNLFLTNSLSSGGFMAIGDMIQQEYEYRNKLIPKRFDWARMKRMFIVGAIMGVGHHYYYLYLDMLLPKSDFKTVVKKIAADQAICSPLTLLFFFYAMGHLEEKTLEESNKEVKQKFLYVYLGDWIFWPPVQAVNFYFLPSEYRVFYINLATMVFDIFLSLMKHYDQH